MVSGNGVTIYVAKAYTAGNNNYADGNYLFYDHWFISPKCYKTYY